MSTHQKQKQYPRTIYVKDLQKVIHKRWELADNSSCIVVFDREGRVLFSQDGKLSNRDIRKLIGMINKQLEEEKRISIWIIPTIRIAGRG